ncbi:MAG: bifunctional DNA primase/polymerase [Chloroflexi bacterium]|nr:bifunctional DNA primase/polymerase [Chloroflexota bacterium]
MAGAGYSVIPVYGDGLPEQPKKPAIKWRKFQKRIAGPAEIESIFPDGVSALGVVCGRVSRLLVIDFDDQRRYGKFCRRFPQHIATYTVKTNRGFHLYFRTDQKVPSHQFAGGDIKGERSYVIAPPSQIGDFQYRVVKDISPLELSKEELDELLNYLQSGPVGARVATPRDYSEEKTDLALLYRRLAPQLGRNNALYRCASIARDEGLVEGDVVALLGQRHVWEADRQGMQAESPQSRLSEALRTIGSAFRKGYGISAEGSGIPNSLREFLLQKQRSTVLIRLLEVFRLAKWREGEWFTLGEAIAAAARFGLNRKSVLDALGGEASVYDGRYIIRRRYVEYLDNRGLKSGRRGRPPQIMYQAPAIGGLMRWLGLMWSPSDKIGGEDIKSAHSYRLALHREYLKRLSPEVPKSWLAKRIGVNSRTIARYNRELGVCVVEKVGACPLTRGGLDSLPKRRRDNAKNSTNGYWLELGDGRRFPAWRHIGSWLLKAGNGDVMICMRRPSRYFMSGEESRVEYEKMTIASFVKARALREAASADGPVDSAIRALLDFVKRRGRAAGAERIPLFFGSVARQIAPDKVAETIKGYLLAYDRDGLRVERPIKRGIAYRMLKQFGEGNVYLASFEGPGEVLYSFARRALRLGDAPQALELLMRAAEG